MDLNQIELLDREKVKEIRTESRSERCARLLGWRWLDSNRGWQMEDGSIRMVWDPEFNAHHTEILLEDLRGRGYSVTLYLDTDDCPGVEISNDEDQFHHAVEGNWKSAVVEAYLKACEQEVTDGSGKGKEAEEV